MSDDEPQGPPPGPQPRGDLARWLVLGAVVVVAFVAYRALGPRPGSGRQADYSWRLVDLDGRSMDLSRYKGRAVFLNVWATWCPPCVAEMPSINRLAADPRLKDVAFVCVSLDDDLDDVRRFVRQRGLNVAVYHATGSPPSVFRTSGIPATFFLARDGRVARAEIGARDWDVPAVVEDLEGLTRD